jgi:hypothetical protein
VIAATEVKLDINGYGLTVQARRRTGQFDLHCVLVVVTISIHLVVILAVIQIDLVWVRLSAGQLLCHLYKTNIAVSASRQRPAARIQRSAARIQRSAESRQQRQTAER